MELPLFLLSSVVMPGGLLPLRLFEQRYIDMVTNCFKTQTGFGVCLIREGRESGPVADPYPIGTTVSIVDFDQGSDGLLHITALGEREFRVLTYAPNESNLMIAQVELLPAAAPVAMTSDHQSLAQKLKLILNYIEPSVGYQETHFDDVNWVCHRLLELLPLAGPAKYDLLELLDNRKRMQVLARLQIELTDG